MASRLEKLAKLWHIQAVALPLLLLISCLVEVFVFNFRYYEPFLRHAPQQEITAAAFSDVMDGTKPANGPQITSGGGSVTLTQDAGIPVYCITLDARAGAPFQVTLTYSDDDKVKPISGGTWTVDPAVAGSNTFRLEPSGKAHQLHLQISSATGTVTLVGAALNHPFFSFQQAAVHPPQSLSNPALSGLALPAVGAAAGYHARMAETGVGRPADRFHRFYFLHQRHHGTGQPV